MTDAGLLRIDAFGKKSLLDLASALIEAAESNIGVQRGMVAQTVADYTNLERVEPDAEKPALEPKAEIPSSKIDDGLRDVIDRYLAELPVRLRTIVEGRLGINGTTRTLQQIADDLGITRERVRQLERKALGVLHRKDVGAHAIQRLSDLLKERDEPLYLEVLSGEDSWFKGFAASPVFLSSVLEVVSNDAVSVFSVSGMDVVSRANREGYEQARKEISQYIERSVSRRPTHLEIEVTAEAITRYHKCPELYRVILKDLAHSCRWAIDSMTGTEILVGYGRSAETLVKAVLEASDRPLHFRDIHEQAEALAGKPLNVARIHNAAMETGLLLGRGTYGLWKHLTIDPDELSEAVQFVENMVIDSGPEKQWHCHVLIDEIAKEGIDVPEEFDHYALNVLLQRSGRLTYLGRQVWVSSTGIARSVLERVDVRQAIVAILRSVGHPMTSSELQLAVEKHRGVGQHFQIHPEGDLVRVGVARWGLFGRDVPITRKRANEILDYLASHLPSIGFALTGSEIIEAVELGGFSDARPVTAPTWISLAAQDERFRVWPGPLLSLSEWGSSRRKSAEDVVLEVLSEASGPMTAPEIAVSASVKAGYEVSANSVLAALRKCGARHSFAQGGWTSPPEADDLTESNGE